MSNIWNPHAFGVTGQPVGPQVNTLRVYGAEPSKEQLAMAQQAFAKFCMTERLSFAPNQTQQGFLPDGSKYRIVVVNGTRIMEVRPIGVLDDEMASGVYVTVLRAGFPTEMVTCFPSGRFGLPDGKWTTKIGSRFHAGASDDRGTGFRPKFAAESWASRTSNEYYAQYDFYTVERFGKVYLSWLTPGGFWPISPTEPISSIATLTVGGVKSFCALFSHKKRVFFGYASAFDTSSLTGAVDISLQNYLPVTALVTDDNSEISAATLSPDGAYALVVEKENSVITPTPAPNTVHRVVSAFLFRGFSGAEPTTSMYGVERYQFTGSAWADDGAVLSKSSPVCDPLLIYTTPSPPFFSGGTTGGIKARMTAFPITSTNPVFAAPGDEWYFPSPQTILHDEVLSSDYGGHAYEESSTYSANNQLCVTGQQSGGAWLLHDNTPAVAVRDIEFSWTFTSVGSTDTATIGDIYSDYDGSGVFTWRDHGEHITNQNQTSAFSRERVQKDTYKNGSINVAIQDVLIKEIGTASEVAAIRHLMPAERGGGPDSTVLSISAAVNVKYEHRRMLVVDPQFGMACYVEAEISFARSASAARTTDYSPYEDMGSGYGNPHVTYSGGDMGAAPSPPTAYIVVEIGGGEVFRQAIDSDRSDADIESTPIRLDSSIYWSLPGQVLNPGQVFGSAIRGAFGGGEYWESGGWVDQAAPIYYGPTLQLNLTPLVASGSEYITGDYAKDPKTGGAVLSIGGANPKNGVRYQYAFTVDNEGLRPLSRLIPEVTSTVTIEEVAAT